MTLTSRLFRGQGHSGGPVWHSTKLHLDQYLTTGKLSTRSIYVQEIQTSKNINQKLKHKISKSVT